MRVEKVLYRSLHLEVVEVTRLDNNNVEYKIIHIYYYEDDGEGYWIMIRDNKLYE